MEKEASEKLSFSERLERYRTHKDFVPIDLDIDALRDKSSGREVDFTDIEIRDVDFLD